MRLKLTVRRNELAACRLLWTPEGFGSSPGLPLTASVDQFLQQVNEVVPLESDDCGLEDYVVEVNGPWQCLHFHEIGSAFKDGDEITISPRSQESLRADVRSGRRQVSNDGRALYDGVSFGRRFNGPSELRPQVRIPPRKRVRLSGLHDADDYNGLPLAIEAGRGFISDALDSEDDDSNFDPGASTPGSSKAGEDSIDSVSEGEPTFLVQETLQLSKKRKRKSSSPPKATSEMQGIKAAAKRVRVGGNSNKRQKMDTTGYEDIVVSADSESNSTSSSDSDTSTSTSVSDNSSSDSDSSSSDSDSDSSSSDSDSDSSSSGDSDSSSSDDSPSSSSDSDSDSSSGSDASSDSESVVSKPTKSKGKADGPVKESSATSTKSAKSGERLTKDKSIDKKSVNQHSTTKSKESKEIATPLAEKQPKKKVEKQAEQRPEKQPENQPSKSAAEKQNTVPPGTGKEATKNRNLRRKKTEFIRSQERKGVSKADAVLEWDRRQSNHTEPSQLSDTGISVLEGQNSDQLPVDKSAEIVDKPPSVEKGALTTQDQVVEPELPEPTNSEQIQTTPAGRRLQLDLESSRRMLFASLGIPNPNRKVSKGSKAKESEDTKDDSADWQSKITLSAHECLDENVKLSTPPFPFVQRWDPQQQTAESRNSHNFKKTKKRQRNEYGHSDIRGSESVTIPDEEQENYIDGEYRSNSIYANTHANGAEVNDAINKQIVQDLEHASHIGMTAKEPAEPDLPSLPADMSALKSLEKTDLAKDAIFAFKKLSMSSTWEPIVSDYQTVRCIELGDDGKEVLTQLARRDIPHKEAQYDENGERIYGKFEMPEFTGEGENERLPEGQEWIAFDEMIDPKLVQSATDGEDKQNPTPTKCDPVAEKGESHQNSANMCVEADHAEDEGHEQADESLQPSSAPTQSQIAELTLRTGEREGTGQPVDDVLKPILI